MYVILAICALLLFVLLCCGLFLASRVIATRREITKREAIAARLAAVMEQAEQQHRARSAARSAADEASAALTTVLPAIQPGDRGPRRVV